MPGIITGGEIQATQTAQDEANFANYIAGITGFDPRVILTWIAGEGHPGDLPGYYNYMNIQASTAAYNHDPYVGVGPANTAIFGSLSRGEQAALHEINALGLGHERGKTIAQQIADIAASPWASSHYGGPGGPNLVADFRSRYPNVPIGSAATTGKVSATFGGQLQPGGIVSGVGSFLGGLLSPIEELVIRAAFVIGGIAIAAIGLYLIARAFGVNTPKVPVIAAAAGAVGRSGVASASGRRRQGDAAAARGEEVVQASAPQAPTRADRRQARANERVRQENRRERDRAFGDVPF